MQVMQRNARANLGELVRAFFRKRIGSEERGQSMVEFALVLPVMLLVVTGITAFGLVLNNYLMLTDAVSIGARALAISRGQTTDPCSTLANVVYKAAPQLKTSSLTFSTVIYTSATASTTYPGATCTAGAADLTKAQGQSVQVTVKYPCSLKVYGADYAPTGCSITAQTTELVQ